MLIGPLWTRLLITRDPVAREYVDAKRAGGAHANRLTSAAAHRRPAR